MPEQHLIYSVNKYLEKERLRGATESGKNHGAQSDERGERTALTKVVYE